VSPEPTHTLNQGGVRNFLGQAATGCGGALNSFVLLLGDKHGLHATSSYSGVADPIVRCQAPSITRKRCSSEAADGAVHAHGSAIPSRDRAMSVHREETAFMTLICHDCAAATDSHKATP
jgi:hypothetical protein